MSHVLGWSPSFWFLYKTLIIKKEEKYAYKTKPKLCMHLGGMLPNVERNKRKLRTFRFLNVVWMLQTLVKLWIKSQNVSGTPKKKFLASPWFGVSWKFAAFIKEI